MVARMDGTSRSRCRSLNTEYTQCSRKAQRMRRTSSFCTAETPRFSTGEEAVPPSSGGNRHQPGMPRHPCEPLATVQSALRGCKQCIAVPKNDVGLGAARGGTDEGGVRSLL